MVEENINRFILIKSKMKLQLVFISSFLFFANNHLPAYSSFYRDQLNPTCLEKYGTNECVKIATVSAFSGNEKIKDVVDNKETPIETNNIRKPDIKEGELEISVLGSFILLLKYLINQDRGLILI